MKYADHGKLFAQVHGQCEARCSFLSKRTKIVEFVMDNSTAGIALNRLHCTNLLHFACTSDAHTPK